MSPTSKVAVIRCDSYDEEKVYLAVKEGIKLIGGIEAFIQKDEKVLLKPNLLTAKDIDKAVTTHPSVFRAVARLFLEEGYAVKYGDSPGFGTPEKVGKKVGLEEVALELGVEMANFNELDLVSFKEGRASKRFQIAKGVTEADAIVSLPKMKTHMSIL